jgi:hypothetical protein
MVDDTSLPVADFIIGRPSIGKQIQESCLLRILGLERFQTFSGRGIGIQATARLYQHGSEDTSYPPKRKSFQ